MKSVLIFLLLAFSVWAKYEVFLDRCQTIGPGMIYRHLFVADKMWNINILEIDLTNPYVRIETVKAQDRYMGTEPLSSMAKRRSFEGHQVLAAINGDFFSADGIPNTVQVIQGQILQNPIAVSAIGFDINNRPWLGMVTFNGQIITQNGNRAIDGVNRARNLDEIILYNSFYGASTQTDKWGTELAVQPITPWLVNDTVWVKVVAKSCMVGNMNIPRNGAVISGQGEQAIAFLNNYAVVGDTIGLLLQLSPSLPRLREMMGGLPKIVDGGKNQAREGFLTEHGPVHAFQIHPRSAVGFNADASRLYFFTVDGRRPPFLRGMTLPELADVMIDFGVAYGLNLDGGGSTTFYLQGEIVNIPTEGHERPISSALLAVSTAPVESYEHYLVLQQMISSYYNAEFHFPFNNWDKLLNPLAALMQKMSDHSARIGRQILAALHPDTQSDRVLTGISQGDVSHSGQPGSPLNVRQLPNLPDKVVLMKTSEGPLSLAHSSSPLYFLLQRLGFGETYQSLFQFMNPTAEKGPEQTNRYAYSLPSTESRPYLPSIPAFSLTDLSPGQQSTGLKAVYPGNASSSLFYLQTNGVSLQSGAQDVFSLAADSLLLAKGWLRSKIFQADKDLVIELTLNQTDEGQPFVRENVKATVSHGASNALKKDEKLTVIYISPHYITRPLFDDDRFLSSNVDTLYLEKNRLVLKGEAK